MQLHFIEMTKFNFLRIILFLIPGLLTGLHAQENNELSIHTVKKKETLYAISQKYGMSVDELKRLNNLKNNTIYVGQELMVSDALTADTRSVRYTSRGDDDFTSGVVLDDTWYSYDDRNPQLRYERDMMDGETFFYDDSDDNSARGRLTTTDMNDPDRNTTRVEKKRWYQVKRGDDLFSISDTYEVDIDQLREWNNIRGDVTPGDVIIVGKRYEEVPVLSLDESTGRSPGSREIPDMMTTDARTLIEARNRAISRLQVSGPSSRSTARLSPSERELGTNISNAFTDEPQAQDNIPVVRTTGRMVIYPDPASRKIQERGPYMKFEIPGYTRYRFYGAHKILPPGSKVKLDIPNNPGYIEVTLVDMLPENSPAMIGLSPGCLRVLGSDGAGKQVTIIYD